MAFDQQVGTVNMRTQFFDKVVKGFAKAQYKFKQAVTITTTSAWKNYFWREQSTALTEPTGNTVKGIPRGAAFPQAVVEWERVSSVIEKYGMEDNLHWEDLISDDIDVRDRTLYRIAERVVKAVDDEIYDVLRENGTPTNIQTVTVGTPAAGAYWNASSAAIIDDLLEAKQLIGEYNYDVSNLMCFVSPEQYRYVMNYLAEKGAQFPSIGNTVAENGKQGKVAGVEFVITNSLTSSLALVVVPKICGTWKEIVPLSTTTIEEPYNSLTIRSVELGTTQLTDPKAVVLLQGTHV